MMWFSISICLVLAALGAGYLVPRVWKMTPREAADFIEWNSDYPGRAWVRAIVAIYVPGLVFVVSLAVAFVLESCGRKSSQWFRIAIGIAGIALGVAIVGFLSILLFNRPRLLIPPAFRSEKGLVGDFIDELRKRRR